MKLFAALVLFSFAMNSYANSDLFVSFPSDQVGKSSDLGAVEVAGVGAVKLIANKNGNQLTVYAQNPEGKVIGKAESVIGLKDTPIYVSTSTGLKKITIYWGSE